MKLHLLLIILVILPACNNKTEEGFGKLSAAEQAYVRQASYLKCINESQADFNRYKELSEEFFQDRIRGDSYTYTYKKDTTQLETQVINIWKKTADTVYFLNTRTDASSNVTFQFIKYPLTTNVGIINDLQVKKCTKTDAIEVDEYQGSASISRNVTEVGGTSIYKNTVSTYSADYVLPAYFYVLQESRTIRELNSAGAEVSSNSFTGSIGGLSNVAQNAAYTDYAAGQRRYCVIKVANAGPPVEYVHPLELDCTSNDVAGPADFANPSAEL